MADLATPADVASLWHELTDVEAQQVVGLLRFASAIVRARVLGVDARIAAGTLDAQLVADVVASMVLRALRNPAGYSTQTVGPVSLTVSELVASGYLALQDWEYDLLRVPTTVRGRIGTIGLYPALYPPTRQDIYNARQDALRNRGLGYQTQGGGAPAGEFNADLPHTTP